MKRIILGIACLATALCVPAQVPLASAEAGSAVFANEDKDWGIAPISTIKIPPVHAPTPLSIPGGRVIRTLELKRLLERNKDVVVIDVLETKTRQSVPGAHWVAGGGGPKFTQGYEARYLSVLQNLSGDDKTRPLVFLCFNSECWLSYNAALRAVKAGYKDVLWYRGGSEAWKAAGLEMQELTRISW